MFPQSDKFWRASDAGFTRVATDPAMRGRYARWVNLSRQPERRRTAYRFISNRLSVLPRNPSKALAIRLDPSFRTVLLDTSLAAAPIVSSEVDTGMASLAFNAWRRWPVKTGFSKALLSLEYASNDPGVLVASMHSNAWYTFYIKSRKSGLGGAQVWRELIFNAADSRIEAAAERIADRIASGGR